ncbi:HNH endonuclease [Clostridium senegalense]|uniref:HNH endonuclease n=1 Tax=Clostridium senegalense TaxID=1465809 RepID=A0A6M0H5I9_9CLOT|nr:HNH endonuclease [Clostridium senegalense]NEU05777.1 HNH endonuclease [Clostridium senegalense]
MKPGTRYPDFESAGLIKRVEPLPKRLWNVTDRAQFKYLDNLIEGGRPEGTTWHHSEIDGRMELVPFGIHNIILTIRVVEV